MSAVTSPAGTSTPSAPRARATRHTVLEAIAGRYRVVPVVVMLALIWGFFAVQNGDFLGNRNLTNLLVQIVVTATIALGIVFVLLIAEIDLSVAASSGACATLTAILVVNHGWPGGVGIAAGIAAGAAIGLLQGGIVTQFGVPSFVVTLGSQLILLGSILQLLPGGTGQVSLLERASPTFPAPTSRRRSAGSSRSRPWRCSSPSSSARCVTRAGAGFPPAARRRSSARP
jgi:D-xylose transport system permease protein